MRRLSNVRRMANPFAWSNPVHAAPSIAGIAPGARALVREALAA